MQNLHTRISSRQGTNVRSYTMWLGSVHLPGDARWTLVRRSRHLPFLRPGGRGPAQGAGGRVRPDQRTVKGSIDSQDGRENSRAPGRFSSYDSRTQSESSSS
ncbi:hypothetical protein CRG98_012105 [Punica granatum]|uniref:Uncharacterized protein n=1 Tax=Punica granatum TaxID=22663 RepID=A0A2I0KG98_PUNGR|nr:hypothetical protein CRG98_012105 [Punica granatum]